MDAIEVWVWVLVILVIIYGLSLLGGVIIEVYRYFKK